LDAIALQDILSEHLEFSGRKNHQHLPGTQMKATAQLTTPTSGISVGSLLGFSQNKTEPRSRFALLESQESEPCDQAEPRTA